MCSSIFTALKWDSVFILSNIIHVEHFAWYRINNKCWSILSLGSILLLVTLNMIQ